MGTCATRPQISMSTTHDSNTRYVAEHEKGDETPTSALQQRRRLSLSQSAEARPVAEEEQRGYTSLPAAWQTLTVPSGSSDHFTTDASDEERSHAQAPAPASLDLRRRRLSVTGVLSPEEVTFDDKHQVFKGVDENLTRKTFQALGIGYACKKGLKPESPNQDDFFILREEEYGLYGVFDGHGPYGHDVSNYVQLHLPQLLTQHEMFSKNPLTALREAFLQVHKDVEAVQIRKQFDCSLSGTTATVVLHRPTGKASSKLYVAHVGDSRAVLGRLGDDGSIEAVDLTIDHKPNNEQEKRRIHAAGGVVRRLEGDIPHRVFLKGRLFPGLAMSRAIGDSVGTQAGVIAEPDVSEYDVVEGTDLFLILCSDGVWEFIESGEAVDVVYNSGPEYCQTAVDTLTSESWNRWIDEEVNVVDDITCQIVHLFPSLGSVH